MTRNFGGTPLAATKAARIRSGVLSGIFIGLDVYSLVKDAQDLQEGAKTASAENMRQEAQDLERKLEKLTRIYESLQYGPAGPPLEQCRDQGRVQGQGEKPRILG